MQKEIIGSATLYCGDALEILPTLTGPFDALITDPPYSSGGLHAGSRQAKPSGKYSTRIAYTDFSGDNRDARSWAFWSGLWLAQGLRQVKSGGYVMIFTDWWQLPAQTDVLQAAGAIWRGIVPWDKTTSSRAPHTGYFRHQCEYVVWGSNGSLPKCAHGGPFPGFVTQRVIPAEKWHMTGKPVPLMDALMAPLVPDAHVLDPFMGSASTGLAALKRGGRFTGIELSPEHFDNACTRLTQWMEHQPEAS
ncbi:MAG: DNA-methyltransferase [Kluyvera sp.]|uniref:DNA-methyltransferase n=1 Tax=Kluyvera sp. TaxID=1538228 RepID=UPI003A8AA29B